MYVICLCIVYLMFWILNFEFNYWIHFTYLIIINIVIYFMLHQGHHREGIKNRLPWGMKSYPTQFMRFPYYEDRNISHLFDTMHIGKNVTKTLWRIIDGRRDKEKIVKICTDIQEVNHPMQSVIQSNSDGYQNNLLWLLT